jgi:soluble lytic murein transglycosylase-like protein
MAIAPEILAALDTAARESGIDPALLRGLAYVESRFDPAAVSPVGAQGLLQLMPATSRELGVTQPFNPLDNARGGAKYIKQLLARYYGDVPTALAAYNWGIGNVRQATTGWPASVQTYVSRVLERRAAEAKALGLTPPLAPAAPALALPLDSLQCSHCGHTIAAADMLRRVSAFLFGGAVVLDQRAKPKDAI